MLKSSQKRKLVELRKEFPGQSARDLRMAAAREHNMELTLKQVSDWLETLRGDRLNKGKEKLAPKQLYRGAVAAEGPNERWQADLAIMDKAQGYIGFLLVVDVCSRVAHAVPVQNKQAKTLLDAFRQIFENELQMDGRGGEQLTLTTDATTEFAGEFRKWCERQGIIWRQRQPGAKNDIAVCDAAMRYIKEAIATMNKQSKTDNWPRFLPTAVKQNNVRANGAHGRPVDVEGPDADTHTHTQLFAAAGQRPPLRPERPRERLQGGLAGARGQVPAPGGAHGAQLWGPCRHRKLWATAQRRVPGAGPRARQARQRALSEALGGDRPQAQAFAEADARPHLQAPDLAANMHQIWCLLD